MTRGRPAYPRLFWRHQFSEFLDELRAEYVEPSEKDFCAAFLVKPDTLRAARVRYDFAVGSTGPNPDGTPADDQAYRRFLLGEERRRRAWERRETRRMHEKGFDW